LKKTIENKDITLNNNNKITELETLNKTKDATIQTKDIEIKDYKSNIKDFQKEKEVNIHII
jgi:hypothetical protein